MTIMEFFGCTFIAFGPPFALFLFTIARDPMRVIVLIASAFFWLVSLLISSILWYAVEPLRGELAFGLVFSVLIQEGFRFLFYKTMRLANEGLLKVSQQTEDQHVTPRDFSNKHIMAYVSGLGFGIIAGAFSIVNVLADMAGPGTIGIQGDSKYFFWSSAFLTQCFILLHTVWGVIFFAALDKKKYITIGLVVAAHMLISCLTLLNQQSSSDNNVIYIGSIIPAYTVLIVSCVIAFYTAGGSLANVKAAFTRKRKQKGEKNSKENLNKNYPDVRLVPLDDPAQPVLVMRPGAGHDVGESPKKDGITGIATPERSLREDSTQGLFLAPNSPTPMAASPQRSPTPSKKTSATVV